MTREEIESLLHQALTKLTVLESEYKIKIEKLEERVKYLEEVIMAQKNMLSDSMKYIDSLETNGQKRKEA